MYGNQETILTTDDKSKPGNTLTNDPNRRPKPAPRTTSPIPPPVAPRTETGPPQVAPRTETGPPMAPRNGMCVVRVDRVVGCYVLCKPVVCDMEMLRSTISGFANYLLFLREETSSCKTCPTKCLL